MEEYRRRFADIEEKLAARKLDDSAGDLGDIKLKDDLLWSSKLKMEEFGDAEFVRRFEEERRR